MTKYTILYKNGKTWNGKADGFAGILPVDCLVMVVTHSLAEAVQVWVYTAREVLPSCFVWHRVDYTYREKIHKVRVPNPASKTKKQKEFDKDYEQWSLKQWLLERDGSIKAYKKHLYKQKKHELDAVIKSTNLNEFVRITVKDKEPSGDWIPWHGGECPVPKGTMVHVRYRDGEDAIVTAGLVSYQNNFKCIRGDRTAFYWGHLHAISDIVAYKLYEEPLNYSCEGLLDILRYPIIKSTYTFWLGKEGE